MNKRLTAVGLTAGLLAGGAAGLILERSGSAGASNSLANSVIQATADDSTGAADPSGITGTASRLREILQPLVDDGTLEPGQLTKVVDAIVAAGDTGMGGPGMDGPGMGGPDGDHDGGGMGRDGAGPLGGLDKVAALLGTTTDDIASALRDGQTLAQIAEAHGSTAQAVIDVLVAAVKDHFDAEVASGEHTQADADARIAEATQRITDLVNNGGPMRGAGDHGMGRGGMPGGMGGADATTSTVTG